MKKKKPLALRISRNGINGLISVSVERYWNNPVLWPFLTQSMIELLEEAYLHNEPEALVPVNEYRKMISSYFDTLKN